MFKKFAFSVVAALSFASASATTIDTTPLWNGTDSISCFGGGCTSTYGETFIAAGSQLNDFSFFINSNGNQIDALAQVYAWSGALGDHGPAVGPALFSQAVSFNTNSLQKVTVNTGSLALTAGNAYVALLTTTTSTGNSDWGFLWNGLSGVPNDGAFVWFNNGNDISLLNSSPWDGPWISGSLAWQADFRTVPEPASIALMGVGLAAFAARRRKGVKA